MSSSNPWCLRQVSSRDQSSTVLIIYFNAKSLIIIDFRGSPLRPSQFGGSGGG